MERKVICALDTSDLDEAIGAIQKLHGHVGAFKVGHALTLPHGLGVIERLTAAGATRIFLDLKFHDIPNSVALAVRQAARFGVWMMTLHTSGGPAMLSAAVEEANVHDDHVRPLLVGVSVLTSLDQHNLTDHLGVGRSIEEQMVYLSKLGTECGLDGVVCSPHEVKALREKLGHEPIIVTTGIRQEKLEGDDQQRVGTAIGALRDGASYLVMGRTLMNSNDPVATLASFGLNSVGIGV